MKKLYFLFVLLLQFGASAQVINFPDANFKAKLLSASSANQVASTSAFAATYVAIDTNADGEIEVSEALLIKRLNVSASSIGSLEGIGSFTQLRNLNCKNNNLTALNLNGLTFLDALDCSDNQLATVNDASMPASVTTLYCQNNLLTGLSLNHLTNMSKLDCSHNQLATLNVEQINNKFSRLNCSYNNLTVLNVPNFFAFQDMGDQEMALICNNNQLSQINFNSSAGREDFSGLSLSNNNFTDLTLSNMNVYGGVDVSNNPLNNLAFSNFWMSSQSSDGTVGLIIKNTNLTQLTIPTTYSMYLNVSNNPNLVSLNVKNGGPNVFSYYEVDPITEEETLIYEGITLENNPQLAMICCDAGEVSYINTLVPGMQITEYCNFTPGGNYNTITGNVIFNCPDGNNIASNIRININDIYSGSFTDANNNYIAYTNYGTKIVTPVIPNASYFTVTPASQSITFNSFGDTQTANFCIAANGTHTDLEIMLLPVTAARPGFDAVYEIVCKNNGNQSESGNVTLNFDEAVLDFTNANPVATTQSFGVLTWDFSNMAPFETRKIRCTFNVNSPQETPAVNIDDILGFTAAIASSGTEETPGDNLFSLNQTVVGSYDPNDKIVAEGSSVDIGKVGDYLHYMIRFQNTGTAAAENVVVKDFMTPFGRFDWNSIQLIGASHAYRSKMNDGYVEFIFEGINLPASNIDETGSHGYVAFKVKPRAATVVGDVFNNTANIYFDYNFPIVTNTTSTTFSVLARENFDNDASFTIYPNPVGRILQLTVSANTHIQAIKIYNTLGQLMLSVPIAHFGTTTGIDVTALKTGTYFIEMVSSKGKSTQKIIKY